MKNQIPTQDWTTDAHHPSYEQNGTWENWMSFGGVSCSRAFDDGYDSIALGTKCEHAHPALIEAFNAGVAQYRQEN